MTDPAPVRDYNERMRHAADLLRPHVAASADPVEVEPDPLGDRDLAINAANLIRIREAKLNLWRGKPTNRAARRKQERDRARAERRDRR